MEEYTNGSLVWKAEAARKWTEAEYGTGPTGLPVLFEVVGSRTKIEWDESHVEYRVQMVLTQQEIDSGMKPTGYWVSGDMIQLAVPLFG